MSEIRGRAPFILTPLSSFTVGVNGEPPIVPYDYEFAFDDQGDKSLGHIKYNEDGTTWKFVSVSKDNNEFLQHLSNTGLFDNAVAGVVSKELTYFIYNLETKSIVFNDKLVYPNNFKYYAIRKGTKYITGTDFEGEIVNICDMVAVETESGSGVIVRKPSIGTLLPDANLTDGDSCIVEFFDLNKKLIARDVFYAEYSSTFIGPTSDEAIVGLKIITTRPYPAGGENHASLFKGESINQLGYSLLLEYNNGDVKDVTHETSNIEVDGLQDIDTSIITGDNPEEVFFTYNNPHPNGVDVHAKLYVHIISDITDVIDDVLPVYYIPAETISSTTRRYFGITDQFTFYEITSKTNPDQLESEYQLPENAGQIDPVKREFNLGLHGQTLKYFEYYIRVKSHPLSGGGSVLRVEYSKTGPEASVFSDKYKEIVKLPSNNLQILQPELPPILVKNGIVPNKFRLRTINGVFITNNIPIENMTDFPKRDGMGNYISDKKTPIIMECFKESGEVGTEDYDIKFTKCFVAYFN